MSLGDNKKTKDQALWLGTAIYTEHVDHAMTDLSLWGSSYNNIPPSTLIGLAIMVCALGYIYHESSLLIIPTRYKSKQITFMYMLHQYKVVWK
jgi:hypothetical protein